MELPDDTIIWPSHNYGPTPSSTIHWEKRNNVNAREYGVVEYWSFELLVLAVECSFEKLSNS